MKEKLKIKNLKNSFLFKDIIITLNNYKKVTRKDSNRVNIKTLINNNKSAILSRYQIPMMNMKISNSKYTKDYNKIVLKNTNKFCSNQGIKITEKTYIILIINYREIIIRQILMIQVIKILK